MAGGVLFGSQAWDPVQIVAQIAALQALFYISLGVLSWMLVGPYVPTLALHQLLDWRWTSFANFQGWMVCAASLLNAVAVGVYLRLLVKRAKKCLDFAVTTYLLHLAAVCTYSGLPRQGAWWIVSGSCLGAAALLGEWLCMRLELAEIPLGSLRERRAAGGGSNGRTTSVAELTTIATGR